jgi:glutathione S-transferase
VKLFYSPGAANLAPHFVLEEIGAPFELVLVDQDRKAHKAPDYLKLNPTGRIPTLVQPGVGGADDLVVFETGAIIVHLVDTHPEAKLAPPIGTPERARFYQWMFHLANTVQAQARSFFYPDQQTSDPSRTDLVLAKAEENWTEQFRLLDRHLEGRAHMLHAFSAVDLYLAMLTRWGRNLKTPTRTMPNLRRHADSVFARPAVRRAMASEGIPAPFF